MPQFDTLLQQHAGFLNGLGVTADERPLLAAFLDLLWDENQRINLVSRKMDPETLVVDHLIDSLLALPHFPDVNKVVDLGTGGGFPVIPLAICRPQCHFQMYEKSTLKRRYLMGLTELMPHLELYGKLEDVGLDDDVDLVICRAFKPISATLALTREYLRAGGRYLFFKARRERIETELAAANHLLAKSAVRIDRLESPLNGAERHLVWINR